MLNTITISQFRCFGRVDLPLKPLTLLIGANDSGKSAFLAAISTLISQSSFGVSDHWREIPSSNVTISATSVGGQSVINSTGGTRIAPPKELQSCQLFQFPSQGIVMSSRGHNDDSGPPRIQPDGSNVPTLFDYYLRRDRKRFFSTVATLQHLVPGLEDLDIATTDPATRRLDLIIEKGLRIPADRSSTGVRLLIAFVAIAYHPSPPGIILLEEPENGIHPKRLSDVLKLLRDITVGKFGGQAAQVILTTHSPYLLDLIDPSKEQVLVFQREPDGSRTAQSLDTSRLKDFLDEFMLGEVWYTQGEEGIVSRKAQ